MIPDGILQKGTFAHFFENFGKDLFVHCDSWDNKPHEEAEVLVRCWRNEDNQICVSADRYAETYDDDFGSIPDGIPVGEIESKVLEFAKTIL